MKDKILYSQGTKLSYTINEKYYNGEHYVWCSDKPYYGSDQPGNSDPVERSNRIITAIVSQDRHEQLIELNKEGIRKGALAKKKSRVITKRQQEEIAALIELSSLEDFTPIIYVIPFEKVKDDLIPVPADKKGSKYAVEYIIENLKNDSFEIINIGDACNLRRLMKKDV